MTRDGSAGRVVADVRSATTRWLEGGLAHEHPTLPLSRFDLHERQGFIHAAAERAIKLVDAPASHGAAVGDLLIVPKAPHVTTAVSTAAVVARLLAFGLDIRGVHLVDRSPEEIAGHPCSCAAVSACSGCFSALATRAQWRSTLPSLPISTVERITPTVFLPYIIFSPKAPYFFITLRSGSERSGKGSLYFPMNFWCDAAPSALTPSTVTPSFANARMSSRKPHASLVQPGVSSFG